MKCPDQKTGVVTKWSQRELNFGWEKNPACMSELSSTAQTTVGGNIERILSSNED